MRENPIVIKSKHYIQNLIEEGEHEHQDFKFKISDARKIARSISAFANHNGGHLLIGVKDNGKIVGVESEEEIYMIEQAAEMYCHPSQTVNCQAYRIEGKIVLKIDIKPADNRPVKAPDANGDLKAYFRVADENILASALQVRVWQNERNNVPTVIEFTEREQSLINFIHDKGMVTVEEFATMAHISQKTAADIITKLCGIHALEFEYKDGGCYLVASN